MATVKKASKNKSELRINEALKVLTQEGLLVWHKREINTTYGQYAEANLAVRLCVAVAGDEAVDEPWLNLYDTDNSLIPLRVSDKRFFERLKFAETPSPTKLMADDGDEV